MSDATYYSPTDHSSRSQSSEFQLSVLRVLRACLFAYSSTLPVVDLLLTQAKDIIQIINSLHSSYQTAAARTSPSRAFCSHKYSCESAIIILALFSSKLNVALVFGSDPYRLHSQPYLATTERHANRCTGHPRATEIARSSETEANDVLSNR